MQFYLSVPLDLYMFTYLWTDINQISVRMEHSNPTGWIFMEFGICAFFENLPRNFKFN